MEKIRSFLSPTDYASEGSELQKHLAAHVPGTGEWLLEDNRYKKWLASDNIGILWLKGTAGTGKSVITAQLIRRLGEASEPPPVLFFFFRHIIESNCHAKSAIRDLLAQGLKWSRSLPAKVKRIMDSHASIEQVRFQELWQALLSALCEMPEAYVVIDGLDEIQTGADDLFAGLVDLAKIKPITVKAIVSSRPLPQLEAILTGPFLVGLRLRGTVLAKDISKYVTHRLSIQSRRNFADEETRLILDTLCRDGQGLFLHARLTLDELLQGVWTGPLEIQLKRLPGDLNQFYGNLLHEHATRAGVSSRFQALILQWATHSIRPLRLTELAAMVSSLDNNGGLSTTQEVKATIRQCCGPLLELLDDGTLQVIHHSFTEFLRDARAGSASLAENNAGICLPILASSPDVHRSLATICLDYLTSVFSDEPVDTTAANPFKSDSLEEHEWRQEAALRHEFLLYAVSNWQLHASNCDTFNSSFFSRMDKFFDEDKGASHRWWNMHTSLGQQKYLPFYLKHAALHLASARAVSVR
jgi:hypothetical protein